MRKTILKLAEELTAVIQSAYEESVTIPEAEKLAARFLHAQMIVSTELAVIELDSRMRKSGLKAIRGAVYMEMATKDVKKPSDAFIEAHVNMSELVAVEQKAFDTAEVDTELLQNYLNVFKDAHIYFRGIAKGNYNG